MCKIRHNGLSVERTLIERSVPSDKKLDGHGPETEAVFIARWIEMYGRAPYRKTIELARQCGRIIPNPGHRDHPGPCDASCYGYFDD